MAGFWDKIERPRADWRGNPMSMVKLIILANIIAFVPETFFRIAHRYDDILWFGLSWEKLKVFALWQPFTFILVYWDIWSIVFFLVTLWFLGRDLEYHMGGASLLKLYLLAALVAAPCYLALSLAIPGGPLFGPEAAFLAILVAYATLWPDRPIMFDVSAKWWAVIFIAVTSWFLIVSRGATSLGHLGGAAAGYLFVKLSGYSETPVWLDRLVNPWRRIRRLFRRKMPRPSALDAEPLENEMDADFISKEVDPILDKIAKHGMPSLTRRERKILEAAREKMDKRS